MSQERVMTGARNENSVLFSLKNLQALATGTPSVPPQTASAGGGGGFAGGEGSGLIDIRALATTTGVGTSDGGGARDELLSMGAQGGAFGALGSPMLATAAEDRGGDKKTYVWAAVVAVGLLALTGVAIAWILTRPPTQPQQVLVEPAPVPPVAAPAAPSTAPAAAEPTEGELAAREAAARKPESEGSSSSSSSGSRSGSHRRRDHDDDDKQPSTSSGSSGPAAEPAAAPKPTKPSGPRTIDDLLEGALSSGGKPKAAAAAPADSNLPKSPSRDQVMSALNAVKDDVQACNKGGAGGVVTVKVSVAGATGRVTNAQVSGATGPTGSCIAQAVRKAQFPKFQSNVFQVSFPFKL